jgi:hypothetical protein
MAKNARDAKGKDLEAASHLRTTPGQGERTNGDRILTQPGQLNLRSGRKRVHNESLQRSLNRRPQRFPDARKAASQEDDLRVQQMDDMRKSVSQVSGHFFNKPLCDRVFLLECRDEVPRFVSPGVADKAGKETVRLSCS